MTHTACSICLKEYHSFDKLQGHLRYSESCRTQLSAQPPCDVLQPALVHETTMHYVHIMMTYFLFNKQKDLEPYHDLREKWICIMLLFMNN